MLEPIDELELSVLRGSVQYSGMLTILDKKIVHMARLGGRIRFGNSKRRRFFVLHTHGGVSSIAWYQDKDGWSNGMVEEGRMLVDVNLSIKTITQTKFMLDYAGGSSTLILEAASHSELTNWLTNILIVKKESHTEDSESAEADASAEEPPLKVCLCILIRRWYTGQVKFVCTLHEPNPHIAPNSPTPSPEQPPVVNEQYPPPISTPSSPVTTPAPSSPSVTPPPKKRSLKDLFISSPAGSSTTVPTSAASSSSSSCIGVSSSSCTGSSLPEEGQTSPVSTTANLSPSKRRAKWLSKGKPSLKLPGLLPIAHEPSTPSLASPSASTNDTPSSSQQAPNSPPSSRNPGSPPSLTESSPLTRPLSPPPFKLGKTKTGSKLLNSSRDEGFLEPPLLRRNSLGVECKDASTQTSPRLESKYNLPEVTCPSSPEKSLPSDMSTSSSFPPTPSPTSPGQALREMAIRGASAARQQPKGFTFDLAAHPYTLARRSSQPKVVEDFDEDSSHHGKRASPTGRGRSSSAVSSFLHNELPADSAASRLRSQTEVDKKKLPEEWTTSPTVPSASILGALLTAASSSPHQVSPSTTSSVPPPATSFPSAASTTTTAPSPLPSAPAVLPNPLPPVPLFSSFGASPFDLAAPSCSSSSASCALSSSSSSSSVNAGTSPSFAQPINVPPTFASFGGPSISSLGSPFVALSPASSSTTIFGPPSCASTSSSLFQSVMAPSPRSSTFTASSPSHSARTVAFVPSSPSHSTETFSCTPSSNRASPPLASTTAPPSPVYQPIPPPLPPCSTASNVRAPTDDDESMGLRRGDSVLVPIKKSYKRGVVRFVGPIQHVEGPMIGVELAEPSEDCHDGSLQGTRYFNCPKGCGIFLRPTSVFRAVSKQKSILELGDQYSDDDNEETLLGRDAPALVEQPTLVQSQYRIDAERHGEWNELFMLALAMEDSVEKYNKLSQLTTDFIAICQSYGKVIISEFFLPEKYKTLQTKSLGGIHGGSKFVVSGILFKLAQDTKLHKLYKSRAKSVYLFGKQQSNYEWASKAGGHELKGASTCFQFLDGTGLHVPMQCLVDYLGFRLICMPYLPIRPRLTHIYGSSDGGRNVLNLDAKFHTMMQWLGKQMHIAGHLVRGTYLYSAGDVEGHLGYDGRYYLLDLARAMPPEDGQLCFHLNQHNDIFYRLLRPELLQHFRTETNESARVRPLNPDCYSGWMDKNDPNHRDYLEQNKRATHHMLTISIPNFAAELLDKGVAGLAKLVLSVELHRRGINVRHLGMCHSFLLYQQYLRSRQQTAESNILAKARRLLIQAMVQHTAKNLLRRHVRRIHKDASRAHSADAKGVAGTPAFALHTLCVRFLNLITGAKPNATLWWETILIPELIVRFGKVLTLGDISRGIAEVQAVLDVQKGEGSTQKALRVLGIDPTKHNERTSFIATPPHARSPANSKAPSPDNRADTGEMELVQLIEAIRGSHHSLVELVRYVIDNLGLRLTRSGERSFEQSPVGFEFVSADVEEISTRVKKMSVVDYAFARVLCSEVDRVSLSSGDRLLQLAIKHLNSSLVDTNTYNCLRQNRMTNARLKARIHNQKGHYDKADSEFMFAMKKAHDCNDVLTMTALGLEIMAMWQQRLESIKPVVSLVRQPSTGVPPPQKSQCGSSSLAKEQEFLQLLIQSRHPALLRRFKQMLSPGASLTNMQLDALVSFFSCGVFEPYHLYERHHPMYKRQHVTSRQSIFTRVQDNTKIIFAPPPVESLKLDVIDELMSKPDKKYNVNNNYNNNLFLNTSSHNITNTHNGGPMGGDEKEDEDGRRSLEEELEFGDISVDFARSGLPFLSNPPPLPDTGELDMWRLDMFSFTTEQAFAVSRGIKTALRLSKAPAWLLGPNIEMPLRRLTLASPEGLGSLSLLQASAQEMLWIFTALAFQTSNITSMTFKSCDFSLVSEMFSPSKQDQIGPPFHVMERVTDLTIVECFGINQAETPWLYDGLAGHGPLSLSLSKMPFGEEDCRGFSACAGRLVGLQLERTDIVGASLSFILRACASSITLLNLSGCARLEFGGRGFTAFEYLSNLTDVNVSETAISDVSFFQLVNVCLPTLKKLDVSNPLHPKRLTHDAFEMLGRRQQKRYPAMRWLSLGGCLLSGPSLEVITRIFEELQFLDLSNWGISANDALNHLVPARNLPRLQHLILPQMDDVTMTKFKANHPHCKVMHFGVNSAQKKKRPSFHDPVNLSAFPAFRPRVPGE